MSCSKTATLARRVLRSIVMDRVALLALLVTVSACDRGRFDTLERRVETLEKKDTERAPTMVTGLDDTKSMQEELAALKAEQKAAVAKHEALAAQLAELQAQYNLVSEKLEKAGAGVGTTTGRIGIAACDEYIEKYRRCIADKVPEAARSSMLDAMDATEKAWREAATGPAASSLATACEAALDAAKMATASMGCVW